MTHFSGSTVLLLVAAHPARGLYTDLSAEAVLVAVADLGAEALQTPLPLGAVGVDLALGVTQTLATPVARGTLTWGRTFSRLVTKLLYDVDCAKENRKEGESEFSKKLKFQIQVDF